MRVPLNTISFALILALLSAGQVFKIHVDEPLIAELKAEGVTPPGRELSWEASFVSDFQGTLHVWAASVAFKPLLRIETPDGGLLAKDDGGGGTRSAHLKLLVEPGLALRIVITAIKAGASGRFELHVTTAPESDETREAAARAGKELTEVAGLRQAGRLDEARQRLEETLDLLLTTPGAERSAEIAGKCWTLGYRAYELGAFSLAYPAWDLAHRHQEYCLPDDDPGLQKSRLNAALSRSGAGDLQAASALENKVLKISERVFSWDDPTLQQRRLNHAGTLFKLGDTEAARALLEQVIVALSNSAPQDQLLQLARVNLAAVMKESGDLGLCRVIEEEALQALSASIPDDHPYLQAARQNLAITLFYSGDLVAARELLEKVLETYSRTLPEGHPELQLARESLAGVLYSTGEVDAARKLLEKVIEIESRTLDEEDPQLQGAYGNLSFVLAKLGELSAARALDERAYEILSRTLPEDHPERLLAGFRLAVHLEEAGELTAARKLQEQLLQIVSVDPDRFFRPNLTDIQLELAWTRAQMHDRDGALELGMDLSRSLRRRIDDWVFSLPLREVESRLTTLRDVFSTVLPLASGAGLFDPSPMLATEAFALMESVRGAGFRCASLIRAAASEPDLENLHAALFEAGSELTRLCLGDAGRERIAQARNRRDGLQKELLNRSRSALRASELIESDLPHVSAALSDEEAAVGYWTATQVTLDREDPKQVTKEQAVFAFVVRPGNSLELLYLGPLAEIADAVRCWRLDLGVTPDPRGDRGLALDSSDTGSDRESGEVLRRLVLDPLMPWLEGVSRIHVALDDVLHLVPLDALPLEQGCVGDKVSIHVHAGLAELLSSRDAARGGTLLALGGIDYDSDTETGEHTAPGGAVAAMVQRGDAGRGFFDPLPGTANELEKVAALWNQLDRGEGTVLSGNAATRENLFSKAREARWLHIATHGWFAPESVRPRADSEPLDRLSGFGAAMTREQQVRGSCPMVLCGLALAGANGPLDALGRIPGTITAVELAAVNLSHCELAVLSACDTSLGVLRCVGQGVASLQKALLMSGAHSVITSLWKVPDRATCELMEDFYRRLWIAGEPKWRALWAAKMDLREARDEAGNPRYQVRDWAGWVLAGCPD